MSVDEQLGEIRTSPVTDLYEQLKSGNLTAEDERAIYELLVEATNRSDPEKPNNVQVLHLKGLKMAESVVASLVTRGMPPEQAPILKAFRPKYSKNLQLDLTDSFTTSFLEGMVLEGSGCLTERGLRNSTAAYIGGCSVELAEVNSVADLTIEELARFEDAIPLPAIRVNFVPTDL